MATVLQSPRWPSIAILPVIDSPSTSGSKNFGLTVAFGTGSEFGVGSCLRFCNLLTPSPKTDPEQVRHTLGFGFPDVERQILCPPVRLIVALQGRASARNCRDTRGRRSVADYRGRS